MESLPTGNFFEVSINSNKLYTYIQELTNKIQLQETRTADLTKKVNQITGSIGHKLKQFQADADIALQRIRKGNQEENNYLRLYMKDADRKASQKIAELEETCSVLVTRINQLRDDLQQDLTLKVSYLQKKVMNHPGMEQLQLKLRQQVQRIDLTLQRIQQQQEKVNSSLQLDLKKNVQFNQTMMEKMNQNHFNNQLLLHNSDPERSERSRKRLKTHRVGTLFDNGEDMSNIVNKIEQFEQKLFVPIDPQRKSILSNSRIVRTNQNISRIGSKSKIASQRQIRQKQFEELISCKLIKIQQIATKKFGELEKEVYKLSNKHQIVDQHIGILSRKLEKQKIRIVDIGTNMKKFQDRKIDDKMIQNLKAALKKVSKDLEEAIQLKLSKQIYQKQRTRINERLHLLSEIITEKAQKSQVKKGFNFFQQKMKDIIIVLAEQRNNNKDGAIKRTPFKCLSCDKDLDAAQQIPNTGLLSRDNSRNSSLRCSTNQLRKRIRVINNSLLPNNDE